MQYLLHAPRHTTIFATSSGSIPCFLRRQHYWAGVKTERQELPEYISTSCIRELEDGTVEIDKNVFDGEQMAGESRSLLRRDGFVEPDMLKVATSQLLQTTKLCNVRSRLVYLRHSLHSTTHPKLRKPPSPPPPAPPLPPPPLPRLPHTGSHGQQTSKISTKKMPYILVPSIRPPRSIPISQRPTWGHFTTSNRSIAHFLHSHGWRIKHLSSSRSSTLVSHIFSCSGVLELHDYGFTINYGVFSGASAPDRTKGILMWYVSERFEAEDGEGDVKLNVAGSMKEGNMEEEEEEEEEDEDEES
ncbi:hypothetical protein EJ02DRAFT_510277 [Clathrospora elynae]|uniref:Uncharacterized protein n=1 Tax=Clathrospora elynae TaxID=706981 RepID=A0A6A5SUP9_9PLEO|nr:hypothetical protein EJ02DRAFT_510277 [Clathrospora elynae]